MRGQRVSLFFSPLEQPHFHHCPFSLALFLSSFRDLAVIPPTRAVRGSQLGKQKKKNTGAAGGGGRATQVPLSSMTRYSYINVFFYSYNVHSARAEPYNQLLMRAQLYLVLEAKHLPENPSDGCTCVRAQLFILKFFLFNFIQIRKINQQFKPCIFLHLREPYFLTANSNPSPHATRSRKRVRGCAGGGLTLVLLSGGVAAGAAGDLEGEQHLTAAISQPSSLQLPVVGAQEEKGVESWVEAGRRSPEIHAAVPQDQGEQGAAQGAAQRGPRHGHRSAPRRAGGRGGD